MKYKLSRDTQGREVELATDHTTRVAFALRTPRDSVRYTNAGITYCYGRCEWSIEGMVEMMKWVRVIDDTVTAEDILLLRPPRFMLSTVDELRFYAELNEMEAP